MPGMVRLQEFDMNPMLERCPVCRSELLVTRLYCPQCQTTIEGHFYPASNPFSALTPEQVQFLLTFIRCEGRFTRMEEELNLSYPTLRNRLSEVIRALGFEPGREEVPVRPSAEERLRILDELAQGLITVEEARRRLMGKREESV